MLVFDNRKAIGFFGVAVLHVQFYAKKTNPRGFVFLNGKKKPPDVPFSGMTERLSEFRSLLPPSVFVLVKKQQTHQLVLPQVFGR